MLKSIFKYITNDIKTIFLFIIVIIAIIMMIVDLNGSDLLKNIRDTLWSPIVSVYIAFGAFIFSVAIWTTTIFKEWRDSLPKRLSVYFIIDNYCLMQCNYAFLSGEADTRQTAQQIGAQIADLRFLNFNIANVQSTELARIYSKKDVNNYANTESIDYPFRHYCAVIHLTSSPSTLDKNYTYIWQPPFNIDLDGNDKEKLAQEELKKKQHIQEKKEGNPPRVIRLSYNFKKEKIKAGGFNTKQFYKKIMENKGSIE